MSAVKYNVHIIVYKGDPLDYQKFRHTGIWFTPVLDGAHYFFHIIETDQGYLFETRPNFDPTKSRTFAEKVDVGETRISLAPSELMRTMQRVPIENDNPEFNCHLWVDRATTAMVDRGYLTRQQCDDGLDEMMEITLKATDEPTLE
ncbi:hypothetical protein PT974_10699 [Cladobotryum mycophilum]|uniref:Uncharacterized protein n=1 Tax=Cladobotryum mycophilum TaxID=491253 RepID=A0ABR0SAM2_9HYPO